MDGASSVKKGPSGTRLPETVLKEVVEFGGLPVAIPMMRASKTLSETAKRVRDTRMPSQLREVLADKECTQGLLAKSLVVKDETVRSKPHYYKRRYRGGCYHIFDTASTTRALLEESGGLWGLVERLEKQRARRERPAKPKVENGAPPKSRIGEWIVAKDARSKYPLLTTAQLGEPTVPRPGSTALRPNLGFWRSDCRRMEFFNALEECGAGETVRETACFREKLESETRRCASGQHPVGPERPVALAQRWQAAALMSLVLPAYCRKPSFLDAFVALNAKRTDAARIPPPPGVLFSLPRQYCAEPVERRLGIRAVDDALADPRVGRRIALILLDASRAIARGLRLALTERFAIVAEFLGARNARVLSIAMPDAWGCASRLDAYEAEKRAARDRRLLRAAGVSDPESECPSVRRACVDEILRKSRNYEETHKCYGTAISARALRSLVFDSDADRRSALRDALGAKGLSLRSDSSFCSNYVCGTTSACLEEVVAVMRITDHLLSQGHEYWSTNSEIWEVDLRYLASVSDAQTWDQSADKVISTSVLSEPLSHYDADSGYEPCDYDAHYEDYCLMIW